MKDIWSRSAYLSWTTPFNGNSSITKFTVQYWPKESGRKMQDVFVGGAQTTAVIHNLIPGTTYEVTVLAENIVGKGDQAKHITFTTSEEEPTAAPTDVNVEPRGSTTLRVTWKPPLKNTWNGDLRGFYVGYRRTKSQDSKNFSYKSVNARDILNDVAGNSFYEYLIRGLHKSTEYGIVVMAYNLVGSGPASSEQFVSTSSGQLPLPFQLFATGTTHDTISLRWISVDLQASPITGYIIYYKKEFDTMWSETSISALSSGNQITSNVANQLQISSTHTLKNLLKGSQYQVYVAAMNKYGTGDPSNIVIVKTDGSKLPFTILFLLSFWCF